jgi:hypothetical protein
MERLVAWNSRFVEMLDLPVDPSAETTLSDILSLQLARGDFGPPDRTLDVRRGWRVSFATSPISASGRP